MNIVVPMKIVPDLVEELTIDAGGKTMDTTWLSLVPNEFDDQAVEQAILLKEQVGAQVTIIVPDEEGAEEALFTAAAKGADRLLKLTGNLTVELNNHALARALTAVIPPLQPDLILTGVQAHNDLDGSLGPLLAEYLGLPFVGYVANVVLDGDQALVDKEYPGGLIAQMTVQLPAVLGIQAAAEPLRYVAFSKIRQARNTAVVEEQPVPEFNASGGPNIERLFQPETGKQATMIPGEADEVASRILEILHEQGIC